MSLQLQLFGRPQMRFDERDVTDHVGAKALAVIAFLALAPKTRVARSQLAGTFWPDKSEEQSRYRLRHLLWELGKTVASDVIGADNAECWYNGDGAAVDVLEFRRGCEAAGLGVANFTPRVEQAAGLANLAELYRGELLEGISVFQAPLFDEWLLVERERSHLLYQELLWVLARAQQLIDCAAAARTLSRLIQLDSLHERNYRALMAVYHQAGDRAAAAQVFHQCEATLASELGIPPSPETRRLYDRIARGNVPSVETELERANVLVAQGKLAEAFTLCAASEPLAADPVLRGQLSLLRAEIALRQGKAADSLSLLQSARQAIGSLMKGRT